MDYKPLGKLYYTDRTNHKAELLARKESAAAACLDFQIHNDTAFYLCTPELLRLQNDIFQHYMRFIVVYNSLPTVAQESYRTKCLVDEIVLTNDLEGVHSTRREVLTVLDSDRRHEKTLRFEGLISKYELLTHNVKIDLSSLKDIRKLYDDIVLPEIAPEDRPDGLYFRKGDVNVLTATEKVKHRGISGEQQINECMMQALLISRDQIHVPLVQIAALHYFIGYIHPYYDGNGRLSRFISAYLLSKVFHPIVAYRLSYTIKQNKKLYYDAFDFVNDRNSGGDLTPFLLIFSELVYQSVCSLEEKAVEGLSQLLHYATLLSGIQNEDLRELLYLFIQNELFSPDAFTVKGLEQACKKSVPTIRKLIRTLIDMGIPISVSKAGRFNAYHLDLERLPDALKASPFFSPKQETNNL